MASQQENLSRLREAYRRWHRSRGADADAWLELMDATVMYRAPPDGRAALDFTPRKGTKEEIAAILSAHQRDWEMIYVKIDEYVAQTNRVVAIGSCAWRNRVNGKTAETPVADFY